MSRIEEEIIIDKKNSDAIKHRVKVANEVLTNTDKRLFNVFLNIAKNKSVEFYSVIADDFYFKKTLKKTFNWNFSEGNTNKKF